MKHNLILIIALAFFANISCTKTLNDCTSNAASIQPFTLIGTEVSLNVKSIQSIEFLIDTTSALQRDAIIGENGETLFQANYDNTFHFEQNENFKEYYLNHTNDFHLKQSLRHSISNATNVEIEVLCDDDENYAETISQIQEGLTLRGYIAEYDEGVLDATTLFNIANFQVDCNLNLVGALDEETITILTSSEASYLCIEPWKNKNPNKICKFKYIPSGMQIDQKVEEECICQSYSSIIEIESEIETKLSDLGYTIDSAFGQISKRALAEYQIENNRPIGFLDLQTLDRLGVEY